MKKRKLTPKQKLFADEYIKSGNATDAYIKAGYQIKNQSSAKAAASRLLTNVNLKSYIDAKLAKIESHKIADAKEILEYFTAVLRGETREVVVVATPTGTQEVEKAPDEKTKLAAARELLKRYPMSDEIAKEQLRKIKAEADMAESKARLTGWRADELTGKHRDKDSTVLIDNIEGNEE